MKCSTLSSGKIYVFIPVQNPILKTLPTKESGWKQSDRCERHEKLQQATRGDRGDQF